jgi:hypothetical protein
LIGLVAHRDRKQKSIKPLKFAKKIICMSLIKNKTCFTMTTKFAFDCNMALKRPLGDSKLKLVYRILFEASVVPALISPILIK